MGRPVKVNLNDKASEELKNIALELEIPESEVLRKGLAIMRYYSQAHKENKEASVMIRNGDTVRELIIA